jgi:hypothetical protein
MSIRRSLACAAVAAAVALPITLTSTVAGAAPASAHAAKSCSVTSYTGAHWKATHKAYAEVTHSFQLGLPGDGTYTETHSEATRQVVHSTVKVSGKATYSEDAIFESVKVSVGLNVAKFHEHTKSSASTVTLTIHNKAGNASYVMYQGITVYHGVSKYYNCVPDAKGSRIGTVKPTREANFQTWASGGGGAVACHSKPASALQRAAQIYC